MENWDEIKNLANKIFGELDEKKKQKIREKIIEGDFPKTWNEMEKADILKDYIGVALFFGLISAQRRHSNHLAYSDVQTSADYLNVSIPAQLKEIKGLALAELWEKILTSI